MNQSTFLFGTPCNHSQSQDSEKDWMIRVETSCSHILPLLNDTIRVGSSGKMCLAYCPQTEDGILEPSSGQKTRVWVRLPSVGRSEFRSRQRRRRVFVVALEIGEVPQRFYLSAKACRGILRFDIAGTVNALWKRWRRGIRNRRGLRFLQPCSKISATLETTCHDYSRADGFTMMAFPTEMSGTQKASTKNISPALAAKHTTSIQQGAKVRRLTPIETERLQGFPDDYTRIPWRNKKPEDCPDGPRYKAMGNSMAVPVMKWIGERIQKFEEIKNG